LQKITYTTLFWALIIICAFCGADQLSAQAAFTPAGVLDKFTLSRHYTMAQGLSNNTVEYVTQDSEGFMWFATKDGLNRFDGAHFQTFYYQPNGNGLPSNITSALLALPNHRLLIGTEKGLCVMDARQLTFAQVLLPVRPGFEVGDLLILSLLLDRAGRIWVGTGTGIHLLDNQLKVTASFVMPQDKPSRSNLFCLGIFELPNGMVAFKQQTEHNALLWQIIDFQQQTKTFLHDVLPSLGILDSASYATDIWIEKDSTIWVTQDKNTAPNLLYRFDWATQTTTIELRRNRESLMNGYFHLPQMLPDSLLLLQPDIGNLRILDLKNHQLLPLDDWDVAHEIFKRVVTYLDRDDNLWLCHSNNGIYFLGLKPPAVFVNHSLNAAYQKKSITDIAIKVDGFRASEYHNKYWLNGYGSTCFAIDKTTGLTTEILNKPADNIKLIRGIVPYKDNKVWAGTNNGCYAINTITYQYEKVPIPDTVAYYIGFLFRDSHGLIWWKVAGNGVACFDTKTDRFHGFSSQGDHPPFPLKSATTITEDMDGNLWFAYLFSEKYLVKWDRKSGVFQKIEPINKTGLNFAAADHMLADRTGKIWINGRLGYLFVYHTQTNEVQLFGRNQGLTSNAINLFTADRDGNMWFATSNGLCYLDKNAGNIRVFYPSDGLPSALVTGVTLLDSAQNILLVSTDAGLCLFDPSKISNQLHAPKMYITGLWNAEMPARFPENGLPWEMPFSKNDLRITFTSINFHDGSNNRYRYRLDGADDNWIDAGISKSATYLNLTSGKYTFRVQGRSNDGVWSEETTLQVVIFPPWWATLTFRIALVALLSALIWWLYQRQVRLFETREKEKIRVQQQLSDLEMKALRSQMNPHFVFNALNSVQNFILKNDPREASRYLTKFARLMRLILENSESPMVTLAREIELLRYYTELEQLRFNHRFEFDFVIDPNLDPEAIAIPGMLIQPHIENAIWHGLMHKTDLGHLWIRMIKMDENTVICEIEDDGVGRVRTAEIEKDRAKPHRSTGLANIKHRLELLNAQRESDIRFDFEDLYTEIGQARGTKIIVRMPMIR
jgi:ligand-binding sensor domain-containing protein